MKTLRPIIHRDQYTRAVEKEIRTWLWDSVYGPMEQILADANVPGGKFNALSQALIHALDTGRVWYADGAFFGDFSAAISKELRDIGARFDARDATFRMAQGDLPLDLRNAVYASMDRARTVHDRMDEYLAAAQENIVSAAVQIEIEQTLSRIRTDLWRQLEQTVPETALEFVEVSADVTPAIDKVLVEEFHYDITKSIKTFVPDQLVELRAQVQANAFAGYRSDKLAQIIQARWGVAKRKAAFLADQETSLFVAKFREARYRELGIRSYTWSTSHDDRVRKDHRLLDKTVHSWDSPPITNRQTGARNHPGEDYRCRCVPIVILDLAARAAA